MKSIGLLLAARAFRCLFSFPCDFLSGERNVLCAILKGAYDRVFMPGVVVWFEIKVTVGVSRFPVNRQGDRAIFLSGCFCVEKGNGTFWFYLDCKFDVMVDGIDMWVEFIYAFPFYTHVAIIYVTLLISFIMAANLIDNKKLIRPISAAWLSSADAKGFSTKGRNVLQDFDIKVAHKPIRTISNIFKKPKTRWRKRLPGESCTRSNAKTVIVFTDVRQHAH